MLRPLIQRPRRGIVRRSGERGVTIALVALAMFSLIAMAALSIDVGTLYEASAEAQRAADAAALAAARAISLSGITGDPNNSSGSWGQICGGATSPATQTAIVVAQQGTVGGSVLASSSIVVTYSAGSAAPPGSADCSTRGAGFGVNPVVTVKVSQPNLPTYFSRIWGRTGSSVSASASAEVFNPSASDTYAGQVVPVQPRCVKPWMVPNADPMHPSTACTAATCTKLVATANGAILTGGLYPAGVIGERFWLVPDCSTATAPCTLRGPGGSEQPQANGANPNGLTPNLLYVPGQANFPPIAVPADGSTACSNVAGSGNNYAPAVAGCDQSTQYYCGKTGQNTVDMSVNPETDTINGVECLIHAASTGAISGQDSLAPELITKGAPATYPFQIQAGTSNPLVNAVVVTPASVITSSNSIVTVPIYDNTGTTITTTTTAVTIVGFLQVFVYGVDPSGDLDVTVMNVSGCGNAASDPNVLKGTSPVPVRLITTP